MMAANELLGLGDFQLLLFVGPLLDQQPFGLLLAVGGVIAGVAFHGAAEEFQRARGHLVEKAAVVADQDQGRRAFQEEILQPLGGLDVEVVGGLVEEHEVRLGQQERGQHEAVLLAAAEGLDRLAEVLLAEAQPLEDAGDFVFQVVGVAALDLVLKVIVAVGQAFVLGRIGFLGDGGRDAERLLLQGDEAGQGRLGLVPEGAAALPAGLLFEVARMHGGVQPDRAAVGLFPAGEDPEQGGFAAAVGPGQGDPLAGADLEGHAVQYRLGAEVFADVFDLQEDHQGTGDRS